MAPVEYKRNRTPQKTAEPLGLLRGGIAFAPTGACARVRCVACVCVAWGAEPGHVTPEAGHVTDHVREAVLPRPRGLPGAPC